MDRIQVHPGTGKALTDIVCFGKALVSMATTLRELLWDGEKGITTINPSTVDSMRKSIEEINVALNIVERKKLTDFTKD